MNNYERLESWQANGEIKMPIGIIYCNKANGLVHNCTLF